MENGDPLSNHMDHMDHSLDESTKTVGVNTYSRPLIGRHSDYDWCTLRSICSICLKPYKME